MKNMRRKLNKKQIQDKLRKQNEEKYDYESDEIKALQKQMKEDYKI